MLGPWLKSNPSKIIIALGFIWQDLNTQPVIVNYIPTRICNTYNVKSPVTWVCNTTSSNEQNLPALSEVSLQDMACVKGFRTVQNVSISISKLLV